MATSTSLGGVDRRHEHDVGNCFYRTTNTTKMKIYVDLDDVLARTMEGFIDLLRQNFQLDISYEQITSFDLKRYLPLSAQEYEHFMRTAHDDNVLINLRPERNARNVLAGWAMKGAEIIVATGRPTYAMAVSLRWLQTHTMPVHSLVMVAKYPHSKLLSGRQQCQSLPLSSIPQMSFDLAVEDSVPICEYLAGVANVPVLMLDRPWNRIPAPRQSVRTPITRVRNWAEIHRKAEPFWR